MPSIKNSALQIKDNQSIFSELMSHIKSLDVREERDSIDKATAVVHDYIYCKHDE